MIFSFFPEEKIENTILNTSSFIMSDMERKYLTFSEFIYNNLNGNEYYQTSTEFIYPRIIITKRLILYLFKMPWISVLIISI